MKYILLLIGGYMFVAGVTLSQHSPKYQRDVIQKGLMGRVKSYTEYTYEPVKANTGVSYLKYKSLVSFNKQGNTTAAYLHHSGKLVYQDTCIYDKEGRETRTTIQPGHIRKSVYSYNSKNNLVEKISSRSVPKFIIIYNRKGYRDTLYSLTVSGKLNSKVVYHYDSRNNKTEEVQYSANGKMEYKTMYGYDSHNNKVEERRTSADGKTSYHILFKYDKRGNIIMKRDSNIIYIRGKDGPAKKEDSDVYVRKFKYDGYDNTGNWLKQTEVLNNKIVRIIKREFEYY
ncbi:MAG TPA: hypothetical protein VGD22_08375 [Sphingobacteriaceae bacterium]